MDWRKQISLEPKIIRYMKNLRKGAKHKTIMSISQQQDIGTCNNSSWLDRFGVLDLLPD